MKLNSEKLLKIKNTIDFIIEKYPYFSDFQGELKIENTDLENLVKKDYKMPYFSFPGEPDYLEISTEAFLEIADEIPSIRIISNTLIETDHLRYYIVEAGERDINYVIKNNFKLDNFTLKTEDNITISLVSESFIVGLAATELEEYDDDWWGTVSPYLAIELKYPNNVEKHNHQVELELVKSYMFEFADSTNIALVFSEIRNIAYDNEELIESAAGDDAMQLNKLLKYTDGMRLFVSAIQIQEEELKFLNFYKILEHYAPIAVNIEANELMRKKLDAYKANNVGGDYIRSIFELAETMRSKLNDEDLIKATFNTCFDFVGLFTMLPDSIIKKIKKQLSIPQIDYRTDKTKITIASNMASKIIYATRNKVVHAKSNFEESGNECLIEDLFQLNVFMKAACSQSIKWYDRQPDHFKLAII